MKINNSLDWVESVVVILKKRIPSIHSADLVFVFFLSVAFVNVSLRPFSVTSCDLLHSNSWIFAVVSVLVKVWVGSAVWKSRVEETTGGTTESSLHSLSIVTELENPFCLRRKLGEMLEEDLLGELIQAVQTLLRCSRRNLEISDKKIKHFTFLPRSEASRF